ncbi:MAG: hypothetical protein V4481_02295 [Patescibacteria group bacterium]
MTQGKNIISKKKPSATKATKDKKVVEKPEDILPEDESALDGEIFAPKEKIPVVLEIEEREDIIGPIDKLVADPLLESQSVAEGSEGDESGLDEEELDPFADKWEV